MNKAKFQRNLSSITAYIKALFINKIEGCLQIELN